jgi:metal-responsive CopG/Arc/MetJ family transcriptional regulator
MSRTARNAQQKRSGKSSGRRRTASKISVTVAADVLDEIRKVIRRSGSSLSAHITEALERDIRNRRLQALIEDYEADHGVITEAELAEVRAKWQA